MPDYEHITGTFIGKGGIEIFFQKWLAPKAKHVIVIAHGLGEHSGRYQHLIDYFAGKDVSFYAIDHRGHGNSGGKRGHIDEFNDYIYDLKLFMDFTSRENPQATRTLLGHSLGGVIAGKYALLYPEDMDGLVLSAPGVETALEIPAWKEFLGDKLSQYMPTFSMPNGIPPEDISRDKTEVQKYIEDPLVHDRVSTRWFTEFKKTGKEVLIQCYGYKMPLLLIHGSADKLASFIGSERIYENASSSHKELHILDGCYHECFNELPEDREKALKAVLDWHNKYMLPLLKTKKKKKAVTSEKKQEKKTSPKKKSGTKTTAKKSSTGKKTQTKKSTTKKSSTKKKSTQKKTSAKKSAPKKAASAKKAAGKKPAASSKKKTASTKAKKKPSSKK